MTSDYLDTIALMTHKLMSDNPELAESDAIRQAMENYLNAQIDFGQKLAEIKEKLSLKEWNEFTNIISGKKASADLHANYNQMLENLELVDGITTGELELGSEHEGKKITKLFPAGTRIKISRGIWEDTTNELVEVWTAPGHVDYARREEVLVI